MATLTSGKWIDDVIKLGIRIEASEYYFAHFIVVAHGTSIKYPQKKSLAFFRKNFCCTSFNDRKHKVRKQIFSKPFPEWEVSNFCISTSERTTTNKNCSWFADMLRDLWSSEMDWT